jgi:hypothetical protein
MIISGYEIGGTHSMQGEAEPKYFIFEVRQVKTILGT